MPFQSGRSVRRALPTGTLVVVLLAVLGLAPAWAGAAPGSSPDAAGAIRVSSEALRATVFGPEPEAMAERPENVPLREIHFAVAGARPVPELFWFNRKLRTWFSAQPGPAPLVVLIAGTGGGGDAGSVGVLRDVLHGAGYHVLSLPSPTFPGFISAASSTGVAGDLSQDSADLRRVIRQALGLLPRGVEVTGLHAVGYSLGGAHAAVVKALDDGPDPLGIGRVVMINPPVSLFESVGRLDRLFARSIGTDSEAIERFYQRLYADIASLYRRSEALAFDESFLINATGSLLQTDEEFAAAIALSFRIALVNMFFAGDYHAGTGIVVDPRRPPGVGDSLDDTLRVLRSKDFNEYFERVFAPFYLARRPQWTRESLITGSSLEIIEQALRDDPDYFVQTNADDLILDGAELDWLQRTLGSRIVVYPRGGHLGNLGERSQVHDMLEMLAGRWDGPRGGAR